MSKTLDERLCDVKIVLDQVDVSLGRHAGKLPTEAEASFRKIIEYREDIGHWLDIFNARTAAAQFIDNMETRANTDGYVPFGTMAVKFQHARFIGVQARVTTTWALADSITGMVGLVLCTPEMGFNESNPAKLGSHFIQKTSVKKSTAALLFNSLSQTFGWPIGLSYAIRNHFVHDGGYHEGNDFFEGPTAASGVRIANDGWNRVVKRAESYGVNDTMHRDSSIWPPTPRDDLRIVLHACELEMDDALGVLIGSACHTLKAYVGFLLGED